MKQIIHFLLPVLFVGCATISAMNVPGNTVANNQLKGDIIHMISIIERAQAPGCSYKIVDTKTVGMEGNTVKEEWTVESCGKKIIYPVELTPDPRGGTYFGVKTPEKGARD